MVIHFDDIQITKPYFTMGIASTEVDIWSIQINGRRLLLSVDAMVVDSFTSIIIDETFVSKMNLQPYVDSNNTHLIVDLENHTNYPIISIGKFKTYLLMVESEENGIFPDNKEVVCIAKKDIRNDYGVDILYGLGAQTIIP